MHIHYLVHKIQLYKKNYLIKKIATCLWISSKDKLISGGNDSTLILYNLVTNKKEAEVLNAHSLNIK